MSRRERRRDERAGLEAAGRRLRRLQTALRLWDDAEPAVGPSAWARTDDGPWMHVPLATAACGGRLGDCLLSPRRRTRCGRSARWSRGARRARGELAWALRRFELGCERPSALEALTDWLLAARALLADPTARATRALAERLAAICATPERPRARSPSACATPSRSSARRSPGSCAPEPEVEALVAELGGRVRAVLRDVLCGHLDPDLRAVADRLDRAPRARAAHDGPSTAELPALGSAVGCARAVRPRPARGAPRRRGARAPARALDVVDVVLELRDHDRRRAAQAGRSRATSAASRAASAASSRAERATRAASPSPRSPASASGARRRRAAGSRPG